MLVTLFEIVNDVIPVSARAVSPNVVTLGKDTDVIFLQYLNALLSTVVTLAAFIVSVRF